VIDVVVHDRVVLVVGRGHVDADPGSYVAQAIDRAFEARAQLDARILARAGDLLHLVASTDEVTVVAAGRDERRIGSVLARLPS
jgi:hypothetical protein